MYQSNMSWGIKLPSDLRWLSCLKILSPIMLCTYRYPPEGGRPCIMSPTAYSHSSCMTFQCDILLPRCGKDRQSPGLNKTFYYI